MFQSIFYNQIAQLIHSLPLDQKGENGKPFWSDLKRPPHPIEFDSKDPLHLEFVQAAANIYAHIFGLKPEKDVKVIAIIADNIKVPPFKPKKLAIKLDDKDPTI